MIIISAGFFSKLAQMLSASLNQLTDPFSPPGYGPTQPHGKRRLGEFSPSSTSELAGECSERNLDPLSRMWVVCFGALHPGQIRHRSTFFFGVSRPTRRWRQFHDIQKKKDLFELLAVSKIAIGRAAKLSTQSLCIAVSLLAQH